MQEKKNRRAGFTLVEMLIVVAIIAILVAIAIPVYSAMLTKSRERVCLANRRSFSSELYAAYYSGGAEAYDEALNDASHYPCPEGGTISAVREDDQITVTCSVHAVLTGQAAVDKAHENAPTVVKNMLTLTDENGNSIFSSMTTLNHRNYLNSTSDDGAKLKNAIAAELGLDPNSFDFRVYRSTGNKNDPYRVYISEGLADKQAGDKVDVTGYWVTADGTLTKTGTTQQMQVITEDGNLALQTGSDYYIW